jgi:hypothetical protein
MNAKWRGTMRRIGLLLVVLPLVLLAGCDGDSTSSTTTQTSVTISNGALTVGAGSSEVLFKSSIGEPGRVEATITWNSGPADLTLILEAMGGAMAAKNGASPLVTRMDVTQEILDTSDLVGVGVMNNDMVDDADIQFTITFTPEG